MRVGKRFKKLAKKLPEGEVYSLWNSVDGKAVYNGYSRLFDVKKWMRRRIEERGLYVLEKARQRGERARFTWHACHDSSCAICEGVKAEHIHFSVEGKKDVELEMWLADYLSTEEVLDFISLIMNYQNLLVVLYYCTILLRNLGLVE